MQKNPLTLESQKLLDSTGNQILWELQQDARLSYAELGRRVNLSTPSVLERVRKLEHFGIIIGYHTIIAPEKLGLSITALIRLNVPGDKSLQVYQKLAQMPEIFECYHVTGDNTYMLKAMVSCVKRLENLIARIAVHGQPTTSLVLSSSIPRQLIQINV